MIPINNSDTAWLVVSDFNQENSIGYPDELREDILNPDVDQWGYEFAVEDAIELCRKVGGIYQGGMVGYDGGLTLNFGCQSTNKGEEVGTLPHGSHVGCGNIN